MTTTPRPPGRTRDRIVDTSLRLFNEEGFSGVSTHLIATETGISAGNLHYHFRSKEQLVSLLLSRFESRLPPSLEARAGITALDDFWLALHLTFETIEAYRFLYRDIDALTRDYPALAPRLRALTARCLVAVHGLIHGLVAAGVLRATPEDIDMLALQTVFAMTCWQTFSRLTPTARATPGQDSALAAYYTLTLLAPHVTPDSRPYLDYLRAKYLR